MFELERKIKITYNWWSHSNKEPTFEHIEKLDSGAEQRIMFMREQGFTSGELAIELDGIEYEGAWTFSYA